MTRRILFVLPVLAALAACGQGGAPAAKGATPAAIEAALDSCAAGSSVFARNVCAHQNLAALDGRIRQTLVAEAANVSDAGAQMLVQGQQRWLETQRVACGVLEPSAVLTADQTRCLETALRARAEQAPTAVQQVGGYTFQTVEIAGAQAVTAQAAEASGLGDDAPPAVVRDIRFPRIDGAATPNAQRFNQLVAQQPQFRLEDQTEEQVTYRIVYAGPDIISVKFETYQNTLGAAHPDSGLKAVTVVMAGDGHALAAEDVFRPGTGWENYLTQRAMTALTAQFQEYGFAPPAQDVRETATKPHLWLVTQRGLTMLFPPYSFGGPHAMGAAEVEVPWTDLRPYLNPNAPQPIGARA